MSDIHETRRNVLISGAAVAAGIGLPFAASALQPKQGAKEVNTITTKDGTQIYFKDWGPKKAQPSGRELHEGAGSGSATMSSFDDHA